MTESKKPITSTEIIMQATFGLRLSNEARDVYKETNLTPRQLAERNDDLSKCLFLWMKYYEVHSSIENREHAYHRTRELGIRAKGGVE